MTVRFEKVDLRQHRSERAPALSTVRAETNYPYLLAGALTFGGWVPMDVEWRCAKDEWIDLQLEE